LNLIEFSADHRHELEVLRDHKALFLLTFVVHLRNATIESVSSQLGLPVEEAALLWQKSVRAGFASTGQTRGETASEKLTPLRVSSSGMGFLRTLGLQPPKNQINAKGSWLAVSVVLAGVFASFGISADRIWIRLFPLLAVAAAVSYLIWTLNPWLSRMLVRPLSSVLPAAKTSLYISKAFVPVLASVGLVVLLVYQFPLKILLPSGNIVAQLREKHWTVDEADSQSVLTFRGSPEQFAASGALLRQLNRRQKILSISLQGAPIRDISPLQRLSIQKLDASFTYVSNLKPLDEVSGLRELSLRHTEVKELSFMGSHHLKKLDLSENRQLIEISALSGKQVENLNLSFTGVGDLRPLEQLDELETVHVAGLELDHDARAVLDALRDRGVRVVTDEVLTTYPVSGAALSGDGRLLATTGVDTFTQSSTNQPDVRFEVSVFDADTGVLRSSRVVDTTADAQGATAARYRPPSPRFVRFSKGDKDLLIFDGYGTVVVMNADTLEEVRRIGIPVNPSNVAVDLRVASDAPTGILAFSGPTYGSVVVFDYEKGNVVMSSQFHRVGGLTNARLAVSSDGLAIAISAPNAPLNSMIILYEWQSGRRRRLRVPFAPWSIDFGPAASICAATWDLNLPPIAKCFSLLTGEVLATFQVGDEGTLRELSTSVGGKRLLALSDSNEEGSSGRLEAVVWDTATGKLIWHHSVGDPSDLETTTLVFTSAGNEIAVFRRNIDKGVKLYPVFPEE